MADDNTNKGERHKVVDLSSHGQRTNLPLTLTIRINKFSRHFFVNHVRTLAKVSD